MQLLHHYSKLGMIDHTRVVPTSLLPSSPDQVVELHLTTNYCNQLNLNHLPTAVQPPQQPPAGGAAGGALPEAGLLRAMRAEGGGGGAQLRALRPVGSWLFLNIKSRANRGYCLAMSGYCLAKIKLRGCALLMVQCVMHNVAVFRWTPPDTAILTPPPSHPRLVCWLGPAPLHLSSYVSYTQFIS